MQGFDFLNTQMGLEYCADDEEIYLEVLAGYAEEDHRAELAEFYANEDWKNYRVITHAIKSTSLTIGAEDLSAKAKELEFAAADENVDFIKSNHQQMVEMYADILAKISAAL